MANGSGTVAGALLLGAGFSRRFGGDKRQAPLQGSTVALQTCTRYLQAFAEVRVVVRADDEELTAELTQLGATTVVAPHAHLGMGHSLAAGVADINWPWTFVGLLDMPFVDVSTLQTLQRLASADHQVICPNHQGQRGHPVGFAQPLYAELRDLKGDSGAKQVIQRHADGLLEWPCDDPGVLADIDRPIDLERYNKL